MSGKGRGGAARDHAGPTALAGPAAPVAWFGVSPRRMFLFLWLVAFSHRLFLQLGSIDRGWPFPVFYEGDAETFHRFALSILAGVPYDGGIPFHPPLYPLFLAACHAALGNPASGLVLRLAHGAVAALAVPLLWTWLRRYLASGAALAGALLAAWSFGLALVATSAVSEGLYLVLLFLGLLAFDRVREAQTDQRTAATRGTGPGRGAWLSRPVIGRAALFGFLGGLLALTRAEGLGWTLLLVAGGGGVAWGRSRKSPAGRARAALLPWGVALAALAVTLAPWTIRNAAVLTAVNAGTGFQGQEPLPTFVVTTSYGPLNFALANHEGAPGYFTRGALTSGLRKDVLDLADPQHRELFLHGYAHGFRWIAGHPGAFLALAGRKLALFGRALRLGWTQWDLPGGLAGTRFPVDLLTPDSSVALVVHLLLLLPGTWLLITGRAGPLRERSGPYLLLAGAFVLFSSAVAVAFFGYARQGVIAMAPLCGIEGVSVAAACAWAWRRAGRRCRITASAATLVVIGVVFLVELGGAFQGRDFIATGETQEGSQMLNRDSIMHLVPKKR